MRCRGICEGARDVVASHPVPGRTSSAARHCRSGQARPDAPPEAQPQVGVGTQACPRNVLTTDDLIWPIFVIDGDNTREPIAVDARRRPPDHRSRRQGGRAAPPSSASRRSPSSPIPSRRCATRPAAKPQPRQSGLPRRAGHQGGGAGDRRHHAMSRSIPTPAMAMTASCVDGDDRQRRDASPCSSARR